MNHNQRPDPLNQAREIWATILCQRWKILPATVLLVAIAIIVITLLPYYYSASTTILFDPQRLPETYVAPTVTGDPALRLNTLTQEVLSAERLQQISQQLHLYPAGKSAAGVVAQMRKDITIDMKPNPGHDMSAFGITYTTDDPQTAAAVANRLAQSFIDWDLANRAQLAASTAGFMNDQLQDSKQLLDSEAAKVQDYKEKHSGELPEQLQSNQQVLNTLHSALQANSEASDRLEQQKTTLPEATRSVSTVPSERDRLETERRALQAQLAALRAEYTEQHPDVISAKDRLQALTKTLAQTEAANSAPEVSSTVAREQMLERETERLQNERKILLQRIDKYQARVDATALREQEFDNLDHNYTNARQQYEGQLDKKFHADMAMNLERQQKASRFSVDPAQVPAKPTKPNSLLLFALAIPLCCLIPSGIALALAEIHGTVNSERELRSLLPDAARVVGRIPMIKTPTGVGKQRRLALLSIFVSVMCCAALAAFLWSGTAARIKRNHAHTFAPSNPTAQLISR